MKKFKKSPIAIACYVVAALFTAYFIVVVASTISTINQYYAAYDMSAGFGEVLGYILQSGISPLTAAITVFMAGFILEEVRKLNPSNWMTEDEIAEAREAKKQAKEAKVIAKGEEAKAKAEAETEDADEVIKPELTDAVGGNEDYKEPVFSAEVAEEYAEEVQEAVDEAEETMEAAAEKTEETAAEASQVFFAEVAEETEE